MAVAFTLNGRAVESASPPDTPLLWALRDEFGMVGVKFGCGAGLCGACTIQMDGAQARACQIAVGDAPGHDIRTIEGLSGPAFEAVVAGWIEAQAPQCGYCQPGFVTAASAILAADPRPTLDNALSQLTNLCRCGTYDAIRLAMEIAWLRLRPARDGAAPPETGR